MFDTPEETHFVLQQSLSIVRAIPEALSKINDFVGSNREYDHEFYLPVNPRTPDQEGIILWNFWLDPEAFPQHYKDCTHNKKPEFDEVFLI